MAQTTGFVQRLKWDVANDVLVAYIGDDPTNTEAFTIVAQSADSDETLSAKRAMGRLLCQAQLRGFQVVVSYPDTGSALTRVETALPDIIANPVQVDAIEVTQAIQDLSQSIPLLAGKSTVVRVYLSNYSAGAITVHGELALRRAPGDVPVIVASASSALLDPAAAGDLAGARNDASRSLNFVVPYECTSVGPLAITVARVTDTATGVAVSLGKERRPIVAFIASPPLRVRILGIRYQMGDPPVSYIPRDVDFDLLKSWLARAYPTGEVIASQAIVDTVTPPEFSCGDVNTQLAAIRALDMSAGADSKTHYYGLVGDGGFWMRGCSAVPVAAPGPSAVGSGPAGTPYGSFSWDGDSSYADWYGGHEIGHTFGRQHPGFCGETQNDLQHYPFPNGQLGGAANSFVGFDVGDPVQGLPMAALSGQAWHDVMTYCEYEWLSPYTYRGILDRLIAEDA